jgi:hypothetical protein
MELQDPEAPYRDLALRRNMLSTAWMDMPASLLFNDASIHDENGNVVANNTFMALLENLPELVFPLRVLKGTVS